MVVLTGRKPSVGGWSSCWAAGAGETAWKDGAGETAWKGGAGETAWKGGAGETAWKGGAAECGDGAVATTSVGVLGWLSTVVWTVLGNGDRVNCGKTPTPCEPILRDTFNSLGWPDGSAGLCGDSSDITLTSAEMSVLGGGDCC